MPVHPRQSQRPAWQRPYTEGELRLLATQFVDPDAAPAFTPTVESLAEAMRKQFPNCDEQSLQAEGFTLAFQRKHGDAARELANESFIRQIEPFNERSYRVEKAANMAAGLVATDAIASHLLANGFNPRELGDIIGEVITRMCEIVVGVSNEPHQVQ